MSRFAIKTTTKTVNLAGGVAYSMSAEQELVHAVLTTFLKDKFYENAEDRLERVKDLIKQNDPQFVAQLALIARTEFNLRSITHILVGELARNHRGDDLVKRLVEKVAERPDDLVEISAYLGKPLPKQIKRGIRHALLKFDTYQLAKYRDEGKDWSLVDLFNLCHPNPKFANDEQKKAWQDLIEGKLKSFDTWEVELSKNPSAETWKKLILENKIGYMALLRNLNNLVKYQVDDVILKKAIAFLTSPEKIRKSKQLPFRFYTAYKNVTNSRELSDAISLAMDLAITNIPELNGKTLIAIDGSGSMKGDAIEKAAIFGASLLKSNINSDVIIYDTDIEVFTGSGRSPIVDLVDRIIQQANGGGTDTSLVFKYAITQKNLYDRIIIISDQQSWVDYSGSNQTYNEYRKLTNTDPYVYAIDIEGYGTHDVVGGRVFHLTGWSERLFDFIAQTEKGESLLRYIKSIEI